MISYKGEMFLPLNYVSVLRITEYLNGSKPLFGVGSVFKKLLIGRETNEVRPGLLMAALEKIGLYCEHFVIIAPFHPIEFGYTSSRESGNPEPGCDWENILECFPNLHKIVFEDRAKKPTTLSCDAFHSLSCALLGNTTLQQYVEIKNDVSPALMFAFHQDFHRRQRPAASPDSLGPVSTPLTMVGPDMIYADGPGDFRLLDNDSVFGEAENTDPVFSYA